MDRGTEAHHIGICMSRRLRTTNVLVAEETSSATSAFGRAWRRNLVCTAVLAFAVQLSFSASATTTVEVVTSDQKDQGIGTIPEGLITLSQHPTLSPYAFVVDKTARTLQVWEVKSDLPEKIAEHPADIGKREGDKTRENDHRTPVGMYFLLERKSQPEIPFELYGNLAFTTDYPNVFDRRVAKGGSGIWLHAIPDSVPLTRGSRGCVVVRNTVIQDLQKFVRLGHTPIIIAEQVRLLTATQYRDQRNKFLGHFESWRKAWESQDIDTYMSFYDSSFRNADMNFRQWYAHKNRLKKLYQFIRVSLSEPIILRNRDQVVIRTVQRYESDLHQDVGIKTIHAQFSPETGFKIVREDWQPLKEDILARSPGADSRRPAAPESQPPQASTHRLEPDNSQTNRSRPN